jgi:hypothetical protein
MNEFSNGRQTMQKAATPAGSHDPKALHAKYLEERDKRLNDMAGRQYVTAEANSPTSPTIPM